HKKERSCDLSAVDLAFCSFEVDPRKTGPLMLLPSFQTLFGNVNMKLRLSNRRDLCETEFPNMGFQTEVWERGRKTVGVSQMVPEATWPHSGILCACRNSRSSPLLPPFGS